MKYKPTEEQKIINKKYEDDVEMREQMFSDITSYNKKINYKKMMAEKVKSFKKFLFNPNKLTDEKKYKEKHLEHSEKSIEQWIEFFRGIEFDKIDQKRFIELLKYNGIPDIKNPYLNIDERFYSIHPDIMFTPLLECVFEFLMKDKIRKKEISKNYDLFQSFKTEIKRAEELRQEIDRIKKEAEERKLKLRNYFYENADGFQPLDQGLMNDYELKNKEEHQKYLKLTEEYNSLVATIPNNIDAKNDEIYFSKVINCANLGLLILKHGDFFLSETFDNIDIENIRFFFISSIILCSEELFKETNFEELKQLIYKINKKTKKVILPINYIDTIVSMRKNKFQFTVQDFNLEKVQIELEAKVIKEQQEFSE